MMKENYLQAMSLSKPEFDKKKVKLSADASATLTSPVDVERIENVLDLRPGILKGQRFYVSKATCSCGRVLSFYDLVFTSLVEQWHSPSFLAHTLTGSKFFVNNARPLRCSDCGKTYQGAPPSKDGKKEKRDPIGSVEYETDRYGCCYVRPH